MSDKLNSMGQSIENNFAQHEPTPEQSSKYEYVRLCARVLANQIDSVCPSSREKSLAITKLEEAVFWANAAIARNS